MAGVPEGIDTEKSSIIGRLTIIGPDDDITRDDLRKRLNRDDACKNLLNLYLQKLRLVPPTQDEIRSKINLIERHYQELVVMLNIRETKPKDMESLWARLKDRVAELKVQMVREQMTTIRVKFGAKFLQGGLPRISIDSLRSRLEKQTGIELSRPPHLE